MCPLQSFHHSENQENRLTRGSEMHLKAYDLTYKERVDVAILNKTY